MGRKGHIILNIINEKVNFKTMILVNGIFQITQIKNRLKRYYNLQLNSRLVGRTYLIYRVASLLKTERLKNVCLNCFIMQVK